MHCNVKPQPREIIFTHDAGLSIVVTISHTKYFAEQNVHPMERNTIYGNKIDAHEN